MLRIRDTFCPQCGERDLFLTIQDGQKFAHCGPELSAAHTAWIVGPDVEATHPIYDPDVLPVVSEPPVSRGRPKTSRPTTISEEASE